MSESIHGHEVMEVVSYNGTITRADLIAELHEEHGEDIRFHTCMDDDMSAEALINFFVKKGKFIESADGLSMNAANACS